MTNKELGRKLFKVGLYSDWLESILTDLNPLKRFNYSKPSMMQDALLRALQNVKEETKRKKKIVKKVDQAFKDIEALIKSEDKLGKGYGTVLMRVVECRKDFDLAYKSQAELTGEVYDEGQDVVDNWLNEVEEKYQ